MNTLMTKKKYKIDWGIFALIEFIGSSSSLIGNKYKKAIDIGSGDGIHTEIMRHAGLEVFQVDKYSKDAEYKVDFLKHNFKDKYDVIFCSHVIEHQRNVGVFLDKIFDLLTDHGLLLISAPKHPAEQLVEGHLNCFYLTYFLQQLIHAGFDLKNGKVLSCYKIENSAIVKKDRNFRLEERNESGYTWQEHHQLRSPVVLRHCEISNDTWFFNNCEVLATPDNKNVSINFPSDYKKFGIHIIGERWNLNLEL